MNVLKFISYSAISFLSLSAGASSKLSTRFFPEESFRGDWDRGCSDWHLFLNELDEVALRFERADLRYTLWGQARLSPERGETLESLLRSAQEVLSHPAKYLDWVSPGINEHPRKGSSYFVELNDMKVTPRSASHVYLSGPYRFRVPGLSLGGTSTIEIKWEKRAPPLCDEIRSKTPDLQTWRFRMFPRPEVLDWMIGEMFVEAAPNGREALIKLRLALKPSRLVYTLLPEKLIENELRFRAQRVLANFVDFRRTKVWHSVAATEAGNSAARAVENLEKAPAPKSAPVAAEGVDRSR
jgi:hypothetical protein